MPFLMIFGALLFLYAGSILPRTVSTIFASPDETAAAAFARGWDGERGLSLPAVLPQELKDVPGLHPRSMVQRGERLVPVGFLGMSMVIAPFERLIPGLGSFLTVLLVLSAAFPLWSLMRPLGKKAALTAAGVFLFFPSVLLYANRGLFPNLPVVALGLWSCWACAQRNPKQDIPYGVLAGATAGLALIIRPTEALWFIPWLIWAAWGRRWSRGSLLAIATGVLICIAAYLVSVQTYGTWVPTLGYWLRDIIPSSHAVNAAPASPAVVNFLPFGFHPRVMWENTRLYLFDMLGIWTGIALLGAAWRLYVTHSWKAVWFLALSGWTTGVLLLMYGQSLYADNIRGGATLGNSFLRYVLPLVPLIAVGIGVFVERVSMTLERGRLAACFVLAFFVMFGIVTALQRDEEAIIPTAAQLYRYKTIQAVARRLLPPGAIVLSERSDKIFAGAGFVAPSPMPEQASLQRVRDAHVPYGVFTRTLDAEHVVSFADGALGDLASPSVMRVTFDNETLYVLDAGQSLP